VADHRGGNLDLLGTGSRIIPIRGAFFLPGPDFIGDLPTRNCCRLSPTFAIGFRHRLAKLYRRVTLLGP
jgi:hypothetical protein